jgi:hypothetical protein
MMICRHDLSASALTKQKHPTENNKLQRINDNVYITTKLIIGKEYPNPKKLKPR